MISLCLGGDNKNHRESFAMEHEYKCLDSIVFDSQMHFLVI